MILTNEDGTVNTGFGGAQQPLIQNLGPGTLYVSDSHTDIISKGVVLPAGAVFELPSTMVNGAAQIYVRAYGDTCDVRMLNVG